MIIRNHFVDVALNSKGYEWRLNPVCQQQLHFKQSQTTINLTWKLSLLRRCIRFDSFSSFGTFVIVTNDFLYATSHIWSNRKWSIEFSAFQSRNRGNLEFVEFLEKMDDGTSRPTMTSGRTECMLYLLLHIILTFYVLLLYYCSVYIVYHILKMFH